MRKGFTIVESMLYMGLLSIMLVVLTELFLSVLDVQSEAEATSAVHQDGQFLLSRMNYDLTRATTITSPLLGASASSLVFTVSGQTYTYQQSGQFITLKVGSNAPDNLNSVSSTISGLLFTRIGNGTGKEDTVKVSFTLTSIANRENGPDTNTFQSTIGLRPN